MQRIRRSTKLNDIKTKTQSSQVSGACLFLRIHNECINILYFDMYVRFSDIKESLTLLKFLQYYANNINYKHKHLYIYKKTFQTTIYIQIILKE